MNATIGTVPAIDWEGYRRYSTSVADFSRKLASGVKELPPEKRAAEYYKVLKNISPELEPVVRREAERRVSQGEPPAEALEKSTTEALRARRSRIFNYIFGEFAAERADSAVSEIIAYTPDPKRRAELFESMVKLLRPAMSFGYERGAAEKRLRETRLPESFVLWALNERKPATPKDIRARVMADIGQGVEPREAMKRGLAFAVREMALDYLMAMGVAAGPDFCIVGTVITAVIGVATVVTPIISGAVQSSKTEEAQARRRKTKLTRGDLEQIADQAAGATTWTEAKQILVDNIYVLRERPWAEPAEERDFRSMWEAGRRAIEEEERRVAVAVRREQEAQQTAARVASARSSAQSFVNQLAQQVAAQESAVVSEVVEERAGKKRTGMLIGGLLVGAGVLGVGYQMYRGRRSTGRKS